MTFVCGAEDLHGGYPPTAQVVANVGCVHEHVYVEIGVCSDCLRRLREGTYYCTACRHVGCRKCPMLVQVVSAALDGAA
jgi:hypothetical protein